MAAIDHASVLARQSLRIGQTEWQGIRLALAESEASTEPEAAQAATSDSAEPLQLPDVMIPLHIELARFDIRDFV